MVFLVGSLLSVCVCCVVGWYVCFFGVCGFVCVRLCVVWVVAYGFVCCFVFLVCGFVFLLIWLWYLLGDGFSGLLFFRLGCCWWVGGLLREVVVMVFIVGCVRCWGYGVSLCVSPSGVCVLWLGGCRFRGWSFGFACGLVVFGGGAVVCFFVCGFGFFVLLFVGGRFFCFGCFLFFVGMVFFFC